MNGLVLAGGNSFRMKMDKALINYHGVPQYLHLADLLKPYCNQVYISSNSLSHQDFPILKDNIQYQNKGPIAGLLTAFEHEKCDWMVLAIDYPLISLEDIQQLIKSDNEFAAVYYHPETKFFEPFLGLYRNQFLKTLSTEFEYGNDSLQKILSRYPVEKICPINIESLTHVNTIQEFNQLKNNLECLS